MGKRELLLIIGFIVVGTIVYQATAAPPGPNDKSFSFGRLIDHVRREIRGNRSSTELTTTSTFPIADEVDEIRVTGYVVDVQITGEDRPDVQATLKVHSRGYTDEEAKQFAEQTVLKSDPAGSSLAFSIHYPTGRNTGRQQATLSLAVPQRLRARLESRPGRLSIANVAGVEASNSGGDAALKNITGRVTMTHRGGPITIENVASLKFTGRSTELTLNGVTGDTSILMEQGGEMKSSGLNGPLDVESRNAELTFENLETTRGPIRVNAQNGTVTMKGLQADTRIDGRNAELNITMSAAAPVTIYSEGEEVSLTPPPGGFRLDAVAVEGRITPEPMLKTLGLAVDAADGAKEARASGAVRGGGPTITVRTTRGDLLLRERDASPAAAPAGK
jgi:hypothetical protein